MGALYEVVLVASVQRALDVIPERYSWSILAFVSGPLSENPRRLGKPLSWELDGWLAARTGAYRVLYWIDDARHAVVVERIEHRADVYRPR